MSNTSGDEYKEFRTEFYDEWAETFDATAIEAAKLSRAYEKNPGGLVGGFYCSKCRHTTVGGSAKCELCGT